MPADTIQQKDEKSIRSSETTNDKFESIVEPTITEKTDIIVEEPLTENVEDNVDESEWQKPISLKALKKKLNEIFVEKYVDRFHIFFFVSLTKTHF